MRSIQLESPLKHVASCIKYFRLKKSVNSPSSNIVSWSLRYIERLIDSFSKNRESFGLEVCMYLF